ncbi:DNA internalization-related competence protein ComEC/Rec2 [Undibacterium sp. SXout7W]|uniref:DNA internalization-related competence protein ComEC/Rec2 n=1 Tax=Undibacterium sp. SXout7W TaxID=3413049 RepID=UPI003BF41F41
MRLAVIAFVAGVCALQMQAGLLPAWQMLIGVAVCLIVVLVLLRIHLSKIWRAGVVAALSMAMGFLWAGLFADHYLRQSLPQSWENKDITLIGTIDSLPLQMEQGRRFNFAVEKVLSVPMSAPMSEIAIANFPAKIALSWYADAFDASRKEADVLPGERWQFTVRLKRPHGNLNPHGFDYEVWLLEQQLRATGVVHKAVQTEPNQRITSFVWSAGNMIERSRHYLRQHIHDALPGSPYAGVLVALVVGDQREISQSDWSIFNRAGIGHLVSISGLHITMIAGLFAGLMFSLWRHSFFLGRNLPLYLPAQKVAALAGAGMAVLYVALAGFGVPAQRTMYMLIVVAIALWAGRATSFSSVLCLALGVVVLIDPWAVLWPGFWLSFAAVGMILFSAGSYFPAPEPQNLRERLVKLLRSASHTQYAVTIGLVPLTMLLFGQISLISPVANAIAIPLISFVVTPLALLGSILPGPMSVWMLQFAHLCVAWLADILTILTTFTWATWTAPLPSIWVFLLALLGTCWVLAPPGLPWRWMGLLCWMPLVFQPAQAPARGEFRVTALDVGQGMALLLETATHRMMYDTGPVYSAESDSGSRIILPYLQARGIHGLDMMMVSHNDNDHSGGALSILRQISVNLVSSSLQESSRIVQSSRQHQRCEAGQQWDWDGVHFEVLQPVAASYDSQKWKPNARSCLLKVSGPAYSMLLPGDIEAVQEDELVNSIPDKLRADVLLAPHHGSGTSSTSAFLSAVQPSLAIFQVGYLNRYHHPKTEVYTRYGDFGIKRLRTDEAGAITLQFGASLQFSQFRQEHARYWYGQ